MTLARPANGTVYCSHINNGFHCHERIIGEEHRDVLFAFGHIFPYPVLKIFRYCQRHEAEALDWTANVDGCGGY